MARLFQDGCFALKSPATINWASWFVNKSRSDIERRDFELLYTDDMQIMSVPSLIDIGVESMVVWMFSWLCMMFFLMRMACLPNGLFLVLVVDPICK